MFEDISVQPCIRFPIKPNWVVSNLDIKGFTGQLCTAEEQAH